LKARMDHLAVHLGDAFVCASGNNAVEVIVYSITSLGWDLCVRAWPNALRCPA